MKQCRKCEQYKNIADFGPLKVAKDGLKYYCRTCEYENNRAWKANNPESYARYSKKASRKKYLKNKETIIKKTSEWAQKNKEKRRIIVMKSQKKNAHTHAANESKRRAIKLNATPKWLTKEDFQQIKEFYKNTPQGYHVDHIIPLKGKEVRGLHVLWNLQYLPALENIKKSNKFGGF